MPKSTDRLVRGVPHRTCAGCTTEKPLEEFRKDASRPLGRHTTCIECYNRRGRDKAAAKLIRETERAAQALAKEQAELAARERRLASNHAALRPEDFATGVANDDPSDPKVRKLSRQASAEKRQEFSQRMADHMVNTREAAVRAARDGGDVLDNMPVATGGYVGELAEQERRFGNRRLARSLSLTAANEELSRRMFIDTARQYFAGKIVPAGYARKPHSAPIKRTVCCMLSDLHIGADLSPVDNPVPFGAVEEARRLEYVLRQVIDYKPQYRSNSELLLAFNGDGIEGLLLHDLRDGSPLAEQQAAFLSYMMSFIGACSAAFPRVRMVWQAGNHGRNKLRHPGRATSSKWDGLEWALGFTLQMATANLKNVAWATDARGVLNRKPYSAVDLHGAYVGFTHADTEIKLGHPDTKADSNFKILQGINSSRRYGVEFAGWGFGHYHTGRHQLGDGMRILWNPALIPPNGHARSMDYGGSCGQFVWEAVEGHPIGDVRLCEVGPAQDRDERLGGIIKPFRFDLV
jgi:hypothetical protein